MNDFFLFGEQAADLFFNASQTTYQPFILCMLLEVAAYKLQRLMSLDRLSFFEPGLLSASIFAVAFLQLLILFRYSFFLIGMFLIKGADLLQCRRGRFQLFFGLSSLLLS